MTVSLQRWKNVVLNQRLVMTDGTVRMQLDDRVEVTAACNTQYAILHGMLGSCRADLHVVLKSVATCTINIWFFSCSPPHSRNSSLPSNCDTDGWNLILHQGYRIPFRVCTFTYLAWHLSSCGGLLFLCVMEVLSFSFSSEWTCSSHSLLLYISHARIQASLVCAIMRRGKGPSRRPMYLMAWRWWLVYYHGKCMSYG